MGAGAAGLPGRCRVTAGCWVPGCCRGLLPVGRASHRDCKGTVPGHCWRRCECACNVAVRSASALGQCDQDPTGGRLLRHRLNIGSDFTTRVRSQLKFLKEIQMRMSCERAVASRIQGIPIPDFDGRAPSAGGPTKAFTISNALVFPYPLEIPTLHSPAP